MLVKRFESEMRRNRLKLSLNTGTTENGLEKYHDDAYDDFDDPGDDEQVVEGSPSTNNQSEATDSAITGGTKWAR